MDTKAMRDLLSPFATTPTRQELAEGIVDTCWQLNRYGGTWVPTFMPGTPITDACSAAWNIHLLTKQAVRFSFNGSVGTFGWQ